MVFNRCANYDHGRDWTRMKRAICRKPPLARITPGTLATLLWPPLVFALNVSLDIRQYGPAAWTIRDWFFNGSIYSIAQTGGGYLMVGIAFGIVRFDCTRKAAWEPPHRRLPSSNIRKLVAAAGIW